VRLVVIESPYAGDVERNVAYARRALRDCFTRGESPAASHLLYTQIFNDDYPEQRRWGVEAGHAWIRVADAVAVYDDYGISKGMQQGIAAAEKHGIPIEYRKINGDT